MTGAAGDNAARGVPSKQEAAANVARASLPDWPRLMSIDLAAQYLGIGTTTFKGLGVCPINLGKRVVWDRRSLDLYVDRLAGQPLSEADEARGMVDEERAFNERRGRRPRG